MKLLFVDTVAPKPYSKQTLVDGVLGGTEATIIRIAEKLNADVMQSCRSHSEGRYHSLNLALEPTHVVTLREPKFCLEQARKYPNAKHYLWLHDLAAPVMDRGKKLKHFASDLFEHRITVVCVSDFHANQVMENFLSFPLGKRPKVVRIYNPVDVSSIDNCEASIDRNKLVFFSSPHKGLEFTLHVFNYLHKRNRKLKLFIANPGYRYFSNQKFQRDSGIINLGTVPHHVILSHVQSALCTFYPNYEYPETFGLVLAESNALETPVLAHSIGAANEILIAKEQFVNIPRFRSIADAIYWRAPGLRRYGEMVMGVMGFFRAYEERIREWQFERLKVHGNSEFSIDLIAAAWNKLLLN
jgi:glycosyltransferase involved in cell wall biosynthesis